MNAAEYLARVGFDYLLATRLGGSSVPEWADEDDQVAVGAAAEVARRADHERVRQFLVAPGAKPIPRGNDLSGARWLLVLSWPDRVPDLKTWAGRSTLPQIISQRRAALGRIKETAEMIDLFQWSVFPAAAKGAAKKENAEEGGEGQGHSGIDALSCPDARDAGFSPHATGTPVAYRPGLELLAIIGAQCVPIVSYGPRDCGFLHEGRAWRFVVEQRDGGYRYRWGECREYRPADGERVTIEDAAPTNT